MGDKEYKNVVETKYQNINEAHELLDFRGVSIKRYSFRQPVMKNQKDDEEMKEEGEDQSNEALDDDYSATPKKKAD